MERQPLPMDKPLPNQEPLQQDSNEPKKAPPSEPLTEETKKALHEEIVKALCTCYDPEIPVNIYELGLIYDVHITETRDVQIRMTLTSPACPVAGSLPGDVQRKVEKVDGVGQVKVDLVWEPPWDKDMMTEAAKLQLGLDEF